MVEPVGGAALALLQDAERALLAETVRGIPAQLHGLPLLEVGAGVGGSGVLIMEAAYASANPTRLFSVDPCATPRALVLERTGGRFDDQRAALRAAWIGYPEITHIDRSSAAALRAPPARRFAFVFVDGLHDYPHVRHDVGWTALVPEGGLVAFHDYGCRMPGSGWGVTRAVHEWLASAPGWSVATRAGNLLVARRSEA